MSMLLNESVEKQKEEEEEDEEGYLFIDLTNKQTGTGTKTPYKKTTQNLRCPLSYKMHEEAMMV